MNSKHGAPHIYINGRFLTQRMTGVERYAWNICKAMAALGQDFTIVCPHAELQSCSDISQMDVVRFGHGNSHFWEQCVFPFFFLNKHHWFLFLILETEKALTYSRVIDNADNT